MGRSIRYDKGTRRELMERTKLDVFYARSVRYIAVRGYLNNGDLTEEEAKEVLSGRLDPNDPDTVVDDSDLLGLTGEEVVAMLRKDLE